MLANLEIILRESLLDRIHRLADDRYRFVTLTCCDNGDDTLDIYYHLDRDLQLLTLKLTVRREEGLPSISRIYYAALLVENEIKELFGLPMSGLLVDYGNHLLLSQGAPLAPMACPVKVIKRGEAAE
jgi:Ni,Fe-hydrogenase III component G